MDRTSSTFLTGGKRIAEFVLEEEKKDTNKKQTKQTTRGVGVGGSPSTTLPTKTQL
jgi:hypothetical protein